MPDINEPTTNAGEDDVIDMTQFERFMVYGVKEGTGEKFIFSSPKFNAEDICYLYGQFTMNLMQTAMQAQIAGLKPKARS